MKKENFMKGPPDPELLQLFKLLGVEIPMDDEDQQRMFDENQQTLENAIEKAERFLASLKAKKNEEYCRQRGFYESYVQF